jgi:Protein of unknown function (DUF2490)
MVSLLAIASSRSVGQPTEVWPEVDAHVQLPSDFRVVATAATRQGVAFPYQQWYVAASFGYQWMRMTMPHLVNMDADKEHYVMLGGGYEVLHTVQSGKVKNENRLLLDPTIGLRLPAGVLVRDRNRVEFRWVEGVYSTTYRNQISVERAFLVRGFRFSPYVSPEFFYNGARHSWSQERYNAGVQWPYQHLLMLDTYYLRRACSACSLGSLNVVGVALNVFL